MKRGLCVLLALALTAGGCASAKPEPEKPLVVLVKPMDVPGPVAQGFQASHPGATVHQVSKEVHADGTVRYLYRFRSMQGTDREARFAADGRAVR